jgi:WD40 repeat protein
MYYAKFIFSLIVYCLTIINLKGMDYNNKFDLTAMQEITAVETPRRVCYFSDKKLVILGENAESALLDLQTKKIQPLTKVRECILDFPILEKNNQKIIMAHNTSIIIHDERTNIKKLISTIPIQKMHRFVSHPKIQSLVVHPINTVLFLCFGPKKAITKYDYVSDICEEISDQYCDIMTMHPKERIICIAEYSGKISIRKLDAITKTLSTIKLPEKCCSFCKYSPDGSCIAAGNERALYIIDLHKGHTLYPVITFTGSEILDCMAFHPNGLLALLLVSPQSAVIKYWNINTCESIYETQLGFSFQDYDICFSHDGLEVFVARADKCIRTLVPFAVKEKCSYLLFILNQLKEKNNLPEELAKYCMHILLRYICL